MPLKTCPSPIKVFSILLFYLCLASFFWGCASTRIKLPEMSQTATGQYHEGRFVWFDLYTDDLTGCSLFYEKLFGWSFEHLGSPNVRTILKNGVPIGNAVYSKPLKKEIKESRWLGFISVTNVDEVSEIIQKNKGSLYIPPKDLPDRGRVCVAIDPQGAIFGIVRAKGGDPMPPETLENQWMGSELWTTHKDAAIQFYQGIAGYGTREISMEPFGQYTFLTKENRSVAGIVQITWDHVKPNWLPYIAVADVALISHRAEKLGGKILVSPEPNVKEGHVAIISDPSGAVFAVQQLPTQTTGEDQ
ncbi:MAG: VOC family protein [Desulfobacter sp.]|nr:VOC family protein [Desulfobacter sp.]WDP85172.1 MAG: VOC family protein [Desulfobacter sp.]